MTVLRELITRLGYQHDDAGFKKGQKAFTALKVGAAAVVAGAAAAGVAMIKVAKDTAAAGDEIAKNAKAINVNAEALQELQFAGELAGITNQEMVNGLKFLGKNAGDAARGLKGPADAFKELGINIKNADGSLKSTEDILTEVSGSFSRMENDGKKTSLALQLFGRAGLRLGAAISDGAESLNAARQEARDLGLVMSQDTLKQTEAFQDAMLRLQSVGIGLRNILGAKLIPIFSNMADRAREFFLANRELVERGLMFLVDATKMVVDAMFGFANLIRENWTLIEGFGLAIAAVATIIAIQAIPALWALVSAGATAAATLIAPWLPLIALIGLAALIFEDFIVFIRGGNSQFEKLLVSLGVGRETIETLRNAVSIFFDGFKQDLEDLGGLLPALVNFFDTAVEHWKKVLVGFLKDIGSRIPLLNRIIDPAGQAREELGLGESATSGASRRQLVGSGGGGTTNNVGGQEVQVTINAGDRDTAEAAKAGVEQGLRTAENERRITLKQLTLSGVR